MSAKTWHFGAWRSIYSDIVSYSTGVIGGPVGRWPTKTPTGSGSNVPAWRTWMAYPWTGAIAGSHMKYKYIHTYITLHYIPFHSIPFHYIPLDSTTFHYIPLHSITFHYITLHYITSHYITLHYITLHYITLHHITLHHITLHYITLHYITLHHITLHHITLHYITLHCKT